MDLQHGMADAERQAMDAITRTSTKYLRECIAPHWADVLVDMEI